LRNLDLGRALGRQLGGGRSNRRALDDGHGTRWRRATRRFRKLDLDRGLDGGRSRRALVDGRV
jgi:hypothetical protein